MHPTSDWLRSHSRFQPEAPALTDLGTGRRWTYAALQHEALRWAARLRLEGVKAGDRVAVLAQNRAETLALLFASAELGCVLFPMNWRLTPAELAYQVADCRPRLLLHDAANAEVELGLPRWSLERGPEAEPGAPGPGSAPLDPWMIMYTSGSTGRPKGALITHQQVFHNAVTTVLACSLDRGCATLTFAPLFHTGGMNCLTTPLLFVGGHVLLTPKLDAAESLACVEREQITHLMGVPTIYQMLADHPDFGRRDLSAVRDALCGGAPLGVPLLMRYQARGIPLRQGFGLTEVGPNCFSMPAARAKEKMAGDPSDPTAGPPGSCVGLPIHNIAARLLRPDGTEVDDGEPGELALAGPMVCAGYWAHPEATAASIRGGWFYTGDMLSRDREGFYYVRGRIKEMYKSGGENVYPAEVEAALQAHPAVALAAVVGVPHPTWGEVGRAFLELHPGARLDRDALGALIEASLAKFKRPKSIEVLDELPRTGSGKIDKAALARRPAPT